MKDGPDIARIAALIGDPARSGMLVALMDGGALTASELAREAGVTKQTASTHLARLLDGGVLAREVQGRNHFFRLGGPEIAHALEALMSAAQTRTGRRVRPGPRDAAMRKARSCYDHLAGEMGVLLYERMHARDWLREAGDGPVLSTAGWAALRAFGLDTDALARTRRPVCRRCLDWSVRRHHLAGGLGAALLDGFLAKGWVQRSPGSRVVTFTRDGERAFRDWLGDTADVADPGARLDAVS